MNEFLNQAVEKLWLSPGSIPMVWCIGFIAAIQTAPDTLDKITYKNWFMWILILLIAIIYSIYTWRHNTLPKGNNPFFSVLFVIDAENEQFYRDVEKKLVAEFNDCVPTGTENKLNAVCIAQNRIKNFDFQNAKSMTELLYKVNCMFVVFITHRVDSVTNAENYMMKIDYAVLNPHLAPKSYEVLRLDMISLSHGIKRRQFTKSATIDEMTFTAIALNVICQYISSLVFLLTGNLEIAYEHFHSLKSYIQQEKPKYLPEGFASVLDNRMYIACRLLISRCFDHFYLDNNSKTLEQLNILLEKMNVIVADTYDYYLSKAYYYVAFNSDIAAAKECIQKCKQFKDRNSWRYSEAFVIAYENRSALTIYKKYTQALKYEQDLHRIVDFIENIIDKEPRRTGLHLAAGLIYHKISQEELAQEHFRCYLAENDDKKIRQILLEKKMWTPN